MNIHLYIERLILDGLPVTSQHSPLVQMAVEAELTRLLTEQGLAANLQSGGAVAVIQTGNLPLQPGSSPAQLGAQIAQSVYSGIGNSK